MHSEDEHELREEVKHIKSRLFQPDTRPFYKWTIMGFGAVAVACLCYWFWAINALSLKTLLIGVPLMGSFGFFIKPLNLYALAHSAFANYATDYMFYAGVAAAAVLVLVFSSWRYTSIHFLFLCLINYLFFKGITLYALERSC
jgi:FtsH-binding integral membrane protein